MYALYIYISVLTSAIVLSNCLFIFIDTIHKDFWKTNPLTGTYYQINSNSLLTWHQAKQSCRQQNAELLSVTNLHEEMFLLGKGKKKSVNTLMHVFKMSFNMDTYIHPVKIGTSDKFYLITYQRPLITSFLLYM